MINLDYMKTSIASVKILIKGIPICGYSFYRHVVDERTFTLVCVFELVNVYIFSIIMWLTCMHLYQGTENLLSFL